MALCGISTLSLSAQTTKLPGASTTSAPFGVSVLRLFTYYCYELIVGRLVSWDRKTEQRKAILPIDARGVSKLVAIGDNLYIGCKSAYQSRRTIKTLSNQKSDRRASIMRTKSKMYIALASKYIITEVSMMPMYAGVTK